MENVDKMFEVMSSQEAKYVSLLWYARKPRPERMAEVWPDMDKGNMACVVSGMKDVEEKFPEETAQLQDPDSGDWAHGFNSGMVAAIRLIYATIDPDNKEDPMQDFPDLDS